MTDPRSNSSRDGGAADGSTGPSGAGVHVRQSRPQEQLSVAVEEVVDSVVEAFGGERGTVTRERLRTALENNTVTYGVDDETVVGVAMTDTRTSLGNHAHVYSLTVRPAYQGHGIGRLLLSWGISAELERLDATDATLSCLTSHPAMLRCMHELYDAHPRPPERDVAAETEYASVPDWSRERATRLVEEYYDPEPEAWSYPVLEGKYSESLYEAVPEHPIAPFLENLLDYERGDALVVVGRTDPEREKRIEEDLEEVDVQVTTTNTLTSHP